MSTREGVDVRMIDWERRQSKRAQDKPLGALFRSFLLGIQPGETVTMLSLPAGTWGFERNLQETNPEFKWCMTGLEKNKEVAEEMQATAEDVKNKDRSPAVVATYNMTSTEYLKKVNTLNRWDIIYFDYMGTWSQAKEGDVKEMARTARPSLFACTISLDRGRTVTNDKLRYCSEVGTRHLEWVIDKTGRHAETPHYKITGTPERITQLFRDHGWPMEMIGGFVYDSPSTIHPTHNTTEMTMVFQHKDSV